MSVAGTVLKNSQLWAQAVGCCIVCGTPMSLRSARRVAKEGSADTTAQRQQDPDEDDTEDTSSSPLLEESNIRVALFRFNLLGDMHDSHVVDKYTMITSAAAFQKRLESEAKLLADIDAEGLLADITTLRPGAAATDLGRAVALCLRVVDRTKVAACSACNFAMKRENAHAAVTYRCFPNTAAKHIAELEDRSQLEKAKSKGNTLKKLVQQIAFYFDPPEAEPPEPGDAAGAAGAAARRGHWAVKDERDMFMDAAIYRCIANLCLWVAQLDPRFRMIAVFYAAWYVYHAQHHRTYDFMTWHVHVFRDFYMDRYPNPTGWFGIALPQATRAFDERRQEGLAWVSTVRTRLDTFAAALQQHELSVLDHGVVERFRAAAARSVVNEKTLLVFACRKHAIPDSLRAILRLLIYNVDDPLCDLLRTRVGRFLDEACAILQRERAAPRALPYRARRPSFSRWFPRDRDRDRDPPHDPES